MNKSWMKAVALLAVVWLSIGLAGCGAKAESGAEAAGEGISNSSSAEPPAGADASDKETTQEISIYQTDSEIVDLKEVRTSIRYTGTDEANKLKAAFEALAEEGRDGNISLWQGVDFLTVSVQDGAAMADIHIPNDSRLGGPGEQLALDAIRRTAFQFDEIQSLDLLVDGEAVESLMGHVELEHPMKKDDSSQ